MQLSERQRGGVRNWRTETNARTGHSRISVPHHTWPGTLSINSGVDQSRLICSAIRECSVAIVQRVIVVSRGAYLNAGNSASSSDSGPDQSQSPDLGGLQRFLLKRSRSIRRLELTPPTIWISPGTHYVSKSSTSTITKTRRTR